MIITNLMNLQQMKKTYFLFALLFLLGCNGTPSEEQLMKKAEKLHSRITSLDTHNDTPMAFLSKRRKVDIGQKDSLLQVDLVKMKEGFLDGTFFAAFVWQSPRTDSIYEIVPAKTFRTIDSIYAQIGRNQELAEIATEPEDLARLKKAGKRAIYIGIENGFAIGRDLENIRRFKERGVNYITLCHSYNNDICDSSSDTITEHNGLSDFGREVVKEMNRCGIMVDVSHIAEKSFYDVVAETQVPVIATHSAVKALCNHDRNMTDDQLRKLKENGGVIQIAVFDKYIKEGGHANVKDVADHIDYAVKLIGIDHVGIGTDFDGGGGVEGCNNASELKNITVELLRRGYNEEDIAKIWSQNALRVMTKAREYAQKTNL